LVEIILQDNHFEGNELPRGKPQRYLKKYKTQNAASCGVLNPKFINNQYGKTCLAFFSEMPGTLTIPSNSGIVTITGKPWLPT